MAADPPRLRFRIFHGERLVRVERLCQAMIKVGTVPSAGLRLDDEAVSRMHAIIDVNGPGDVSIIDLGSRAGTFVNGTKINKAKLETGDTIVVGATRLELAIDPADDSDHEDAPARPVVAWAPSGAVGSARDQTRLRFRIFHGDELVRVQRFRRAAIKIGTIEPAHLRLEDDQVSRMHAIIEVAGPDDVTIIDLGSRTGTFVNGKKVNKATLETGDTIVVGATRLELAIDLDDGEDPEVIPAPTPAVVPDPNPPDPMMAFTYSLYRLGPASKELVATLISVFDKLSAPANSVEVATLIETEVVLAFDAFLAEATRLSKFVDAQIERHVWARSPHLAMVHDMTEAHQVARDQLAALALRGHAAAITVPELWLELSAIFIAFANRTDGSPPDDADLPVRS